MVSGGKKHRVTGLCAGGGGESLGGGAYRPVDGRTRLAFDREISPGGSTRRAALAIASSALRAQQALVSPDAGDSFIMLSADRHGTDFGGNHGQGRLAVAPLGLVT